MDRFIMKLAYDLLQKRNVIEFTMFVSALSQMWVFSVHELLKMWLGK